LVAKGEDQRQNAASPHVSLRQAVRPVIMAYGILSDERRAASALAAEAQTLLDLTENLLRKLGLIHLLTAGSARLADGQAPADRLVEAYAQAGMSWAKVVSSVARLAGLLIEERDWESARRVADLIADTGEAAVAEHIQTLIRDAQLATIHVHASMTGVEIRRAVAALTAIGGPRRKMLIIAWRWNLIVSALAIARQKNIEPALQLAKQLNGRLSALANYPALEDNPERGLPEEVFIPGLITVLDLCEG
jgi:hypothetical protein